ncbi:MAG: MlaE family ABC transporter permease [Bacteroidaceae bacterium]
MVSIKESLQGLGEYVLLIGKAISVPDRWKMFWKQYVTEMFQLGYNSIGIVLIISFFIGAVICLQIKLNIQSAWMPTMVTGYTTREIMLLEFSSSIMCLILAGKVGSNIASELGTMRITQQIDALEIMGVNSANFLILPKVLGLMTIMPILVTFSVFAGIMGAYATTLLGTTSIAELNEGFRYEFNQWFFWCGIVKAVVYAFIITTISSYKGYSVEGGSVEVGKASTSAVVTSSIYILFSDIFLTNMLT